MSATVSLPRSARSMKESAAPPQRDSSDCGSTWWLSASGSWYYGINWMSCSCWRKEKNSSVRAPTWRLAKV